MIHQSVSRREMFVNDRRRGHRPVLPKRFMILCEYTRVCNLGIFLKATIYCYTLVLFLQVMNVTNSFSYLPHSVDHSKTQTRKKEIPVFNFLMHISAVSSTVFTTVCSKIQILTNDEKNKKTQREGERSKSKSQSH